MQHTVHIKLSSAGQVAALRAGLPAQAEQSFPIPAERIGAALDTGHVTIARDGSVALQWPDPLVYGDPSTALDAPPDDPLNAAIAAWARRDAHQAEVEAAETDRRRKCAAEEAERVRARQEQAARWAALPLADRASAGGILYIYEEHGGPANLSAFAADAWREAEAEYARLAGEKAADEVDAADRRLARLAQLAALHGDNSVRDRIAAGPAPLGFLPKAEAEQIVLDTMLPPQIGDVQEYTKITNKDVRAFCACGRDYPDEDGNSYDGSVSFRVVDPADGGISAEDWGTAETLRAALSAHFTASTFVFSPTRLHVGECDGEDCPARAVTRVGIRVTADLGDGLVLSREYGHKQ